MRFGAFVSILFLGLVMVTANVFALAAVESRTAAPYHSSQSSMQSGEMSTARTTEERAARLTLHQIESLKQEVNELRGLVEVQENQINQLKKSQQDLYLDLEKRITEAQKNNKNNISSKENSTISKNKKNTIVVIENPSIEKAANKKELSPNIKNISEPEKSLEEEEFVGDNETVENAKAGTTEEKSASKKPSSVTITPISSPVISATSEKDAYESAYSMVRNKKYSEAIVALKNYLGEFPHGERAATAHYWLGEVYLVQWQANKNDKTLLDEANHAFITIKNQFPKHPKVSDALLKLGLIENEKGNFEGARRYWLETKTNHPGTAAARIAESRLQQLTS